MLWVGGLSDVRVPDGGSPDVAAAWGDETMEKDRFCLVHMNECIRNIQHYVADGRVGFMGSVMVQDAVMWNLQLFSAMAMRVSDMQKSLHPEVDWDHACGIFKDLAANPWKVEPGDVWDCIEGELPALEFSLQTLLRTEAARR